MTLKTRLTDPIRNAFENNYESNVAKVRLKYYPHWMRVCGVDCAEDIDWSNPIVSLEWKLCDISTQAKLTSKKKELRDMVLETFTEEER